MDGADRARAAIVGRDFELEAVGRWLGSERPTLLEIEGEAGIGKTTLWEAAVRAARDAGALVLACRPVEIETAVSYGALASLLEASLGAVADEVPAPRVRALEGALRLRDVPGSRLDETAVALGVLSVLRALAVRQPVVVGLEDVQWLDASSRVALTYALRHLQPDDDVAVVLACRTEPGSRPLDLGGSALDDARETLRLDGLSIGAVHRIVHRRLGTSLSRPRLVRVHYASGGNPFHAIELARVVADADPNEVELALPASLGAVLTARLDALSEQARRVLLAAAAAGEPSRRLLADALGEDAIDGALDEASRHGIVVREDDRVRFTHPLLASTVYAAATDGERRRAHARLAELATSAEERARHLALAGSGPDEDVASALARAAESACARGARGAGASLYEQAAALSEDDEGRGARLVAAADAHFMAGESERAQTLLEEVAASAGALRFEALWRLGTLLDETVGGEASLGPFEEALGTDDPALAAQVHRSLAQAVVYVGDGERALGHADASVAAAEAQGDRTLLAYGLSMQALVRKIQAHPAWHESLERALELETDLQLVELDVCPSAIEADTRRLLFQLDEARAAYERMLERATDAGDVRAESWCRYGFAVVELLAGRLPEAAEHADELSNIAEQTSLMRLPALRAAAHVALLRGEVERARQLLGEVAAEAEPMGELLNLRAALQLEGLLELSLGDAEAAVEPLRRARSIAEQMGVGEPSMLAFQLDEVEALAVQGDADQAEAVLRRFEERSAADPSPWIRPLVLRGRGLVLAARGDLEAARDALEQALAAQEDLPLPLERARTLLVLGRVLRRVQQRGAAHATLAEAQERFDALGTPLWSERARDELARIGGRTPSRDELTPTERQIAELVAAGRTNREVASTLFVTPKTVEAALTRVYRKLGVRSRTELARQLMDRA